MNMRTLTIGTRKHTQVEALDKKGQGNANHKYKIYKAVVNGSDLNEGLCLIEFQNGPVKEKGVNGIHNEDLIAIVIDRLAGFQSGCESDTTCNCGSLSYRLHMKLVLRHSSSSSARLKVPPARICFSCPRL